MSEIWPDWLVGTLRLRCSRSADACLLSATAGVLIAVGLSTVVQAGNHPVVLTPRPVVVATHSASLAESVPLDHWMDVQRELSTPNPNSTQPLTLNSLSQAS
jgi:hypothetical protein